MSDLPERTAAPTAVSDLDLEATAATAEVLFEISRERGRQDARWGEQNHPDGTGPEVIWPQAGAMFAVAAECKRLCKASGKPGGEGDSWFKVLAEEVTEAFAESDPLMLRAELIQTAAVAVAWIECIDRRVRDE